MNLHWLLVFLLCGTGTECSPSGQPGLTRDSRSLKPFPAFVYQDSCSFDPNGQPTTTTLQEGQQPSLVRKSPEDMFGPFPNSLSQVAHGRAPGRNRGSPHLPAFDSQVWITVTDSIKFNLGAGSITDTIWPKYFYPTMPAASPYTSVEWGADYNSGAKLTVRGNGDFTPSVVLSQLYYADASEPKTNNGEAVGGNWVAFGTSDATLDSTDASGSWNKHLDFQFKWEATDEAVSSGALVVLTFTVIANPVDWTWQQGSCLYLGLSDDTFPGAWGGKKEKGGN